VLDSKNLIKQMLDILEDIEGDFAQVKRLGDYGNLVDRIMGGAKNIAILADEKHASNLISDYAALCKAVGYKASQIKDNEQFYDICVALLMDATETLNNIVDCVDFDVETVKKTVPITFIERIRWVSSQFSKEYRESVGSGGKVEEEKQLSQTEIDDLMKKLGF
jgi:chemotaxis regulatin CheY-phosphate phosphatase CheZ